MRDATKIFLMLCLIASKAFATDYFIRPIGNDTNSGTGNTFTTAWQTLCPINDKNFLPGDNIFIEGSFAYPGFIYLDQTDFGTAANPITITSFGKGRATINSDTSIGFYALNTAGIVIKNLNFTGSGIYSNKDNGVFFYSDQTSEQLDFIRIDSLTVSGYQKSGICIHANASANKGYTNVRITNCISHTNGESGIASFGSDKTNLYAHKNFYIGHNTVYNNTGRSEVTTTHTGNGIMISAVDHCIIEHNIAYGNGAQNGQASGGPVGIWCFAANDVIIQYCESYNNKAGKSCDGGGFDFDGGVTNSIMQYNYSHNNEGAGFLLYQYSGAIPFNNNTVRYNISENDGRKNGYSGIFLSSSRSSDGIQNTNVYNNTIYITSTYPIPSGIITEGHIVNSSIRNNIIQTTGGVPLITARTTSGVLFQGNCYWSSGRKFKINWGTKTYKSLSNWRKATEQEKNASLNTGYRKNPKLNSPGNGGTIGNTFLLNTMSAYKLSSSSKLINTGLNLNSLFGINPGIKDYYGNTLLPNTFFEIGANEYVETGVQVQRKITREE